MNEVSKYVSSDGNFTHINIEGTEKEIKYFINKYKETKHYKNLPLYAQFILESGIFPEIIHTKIVPVGMILEVVMPSSEKKFTEDNLNELEGGIKFRIPVRYQLEKDK